MILFLVDGNVQEYEVLKRSTVNIFLDKFEAKARQHEQDKQRAAQQKTSGKRR